MEICFDSLMTSALDEPDSIYGLVAETVTISADRNSFDFALRPEARFHDGSPLTAEDVAFTYKLFKENGHPDLLLPLRELSDAVAVDPHTLRLTFSGKQSDRTILDVATFPILSKAYFDKVPFDSSRLDAPLGSGPYKVGLVRAGQTIEYERVADYWGRDLPVNRGLYNFDRLRIEFYGDRQAAFEAFKKGEMLFREEFDLAPLGDRLRFPGARTTARWSSASSRRRSARPCRRSRSTSAASASGTCACAARSRCASTSNGRTQSCSTGSTTARSRASNDRSSRRAGMPSPEELALLEPLRDRLPPEVFGEAYSLPASDGTRPRPQAARRGARA